MKKELVEYLEYKKMTSVRLRVGTNLILLLENVNTKYGGNVLIAKSKSILKILH